MSRPEEDINAVEQSKEGESPVNRIDDDFFSSGRELEDDRTEEKEMDEGPNVKGVVGWGDVSCLGSISRG